VIRRVFYGMELVIFFCRELFIATLQVAVFVLIPNSRLRPAILSVPLDIKSEVGIMILANIVTLTPGTLTLDVSADKRRLFVHIFHAPNPEKTIASLKRGFERRIQRIFE